MIDPHVHWIIQENQTDLREVRTIVEALEREGHIPHLAFLTKGSEIPPIPDLPVDVPVVCQGPAFVPRALNYPRLSSGLFFDPATFRWSAFQAGWNEAMLSRDAAILPISEAQRQLHSRASAFVRPNADSKAFEGRVYSADALAAEVAHLDESTPVVLAEPVPIEAEWRFFIVDREVVGCSEYRRWGRTSTQGSVPHRAIEFAAECALRWGPSDIYCLDLAATDNRIGVVEANCFNASRFYAAVIDRTLRAVNAFVLSRFERGG